MLESRPCIDGKHWITRAESNVCYCLRFLVYSKKERADVFGRIARFRIFFILFTLLIPALLFPSGVVNS